MQRKEGARGRRKRQWARGKQPKAPSTAASTPKGAGRNGHRGDLDDPARESRTQEPSIPQDVLQRRRVTIHPKRIFHREIQQRGSKGTLSRHRQDTRPPMVKGSPNRLPEDSRRSPRLGLGQETNER